MTGITEGSRGESHSRLPNSTAVERFLRGLLSASTASAAAQAAVDAVRESLGTDLSWVGMISGDVLKMAAHNGLRTTEMMTAWRLAVGQGVGGRVAKEGKPLITKDYRRDPRRVQVMKSLIDAEGLTSGMVVPILNGGEVLGVLYAASREPREWMAAEQDLLMTLGRDLGVAIAQIREHRRSEGFAQAAHRAEGGVRAATAIAAAVASDDALGAGLDVFAHHLNCRVEIIDQAGELLRSVPHTPAEDAPAAVWERNLSVVGFGPLRVYRETGLDSAEQGFAELAAQVLVLQLMRERAALLQRLRLRDELLNDLFAHGLTRPEVLRERAAVLGLNLAVPHFIVCIGAHQRDDMPYLGAAKPDLDAFGAAALVRFPGSILIRRTTSVVIAIPARPQSEAVTQTTLRALLRSSGTAVSGGVSRICLTASDYADAYQEANAALGLAQRRADAGELFTATDVGLLGLLTTSHRDSLGNVIESSLGPLFQIDASSGSDYLKTLDAFLANDRHLERTANALHVHPNTVRYRISKVQEMLEVDLHDVEARFLLELAIRVHAMTSSVTET